MASGRRYDQSALRYVLNTRENELLHYYLKLAGDSERSKSRSEAHYKHAKLRDDYHAATIRSSLRVFIGMTAGLKSWDLISRSLFTHGTSQRPRPKRPLLSSTNFRLALSLSSILFLHRLLHRFFLRLRLRLLKEKASQLSARHTKLFRALTARIAPAMGASLAGLALSMYPSCQLRMTLAIYISARALEMLYNAFEKDGYLGKKPWWFGSWMLFPLAQGQLLHAFVFDRYCCPKVYGDFLLEHTPNYVQRRPSNISRSLQWPTADQIIVSLAEMAQLKWPPFVSPILHPANLMPLPPTIDPVISPITSRAHPSISHLSCALTHPSDPSCFSAYLSHNILSFVGLARFFAFFYIAMALPQYKHFLSSPISSLNQLSKTILQTTAAISGTIGSSWGSICLFASIFPRTFLPRFRFFLGGFLGGCFQFLDRTAAGRVNSLYVTRLSVDSLWKVGLKHRWWKGFKGGDVVVFVAGLALLNAVYELRSEAVDDKGMKIVMKVLRGDMEIGLQEKSQTQSEKNAP